MTPESIRAFLLSALEFGFRECERDHNLETAKKNYLDLIYPDRPDIPRVVLADKRMDNAESALMEFARAMPATDSAHERRVEFCDFKNKVCLYPTICPLKGYCTHRY